MSKFIDNLKLEYNKLLKREKGAEYFLNNVATAREIEKWEPEFIKITVELSILINKFKSTTGREMTVDEIINGFKDVAS